LKVRDVLKRLRKEGWYIARQSGSHRVFRHAENPGIVVVAGHPAKDLPLGTLKHILEQAGWENIE
jgi:predicted RNA binding protein YcfA (HicA-like mRNA interferase family)